MQHIIHLTLQPTAAQMIALRQTQEMINAARNEISAVAYYTGTFSTRALYEACAEDVSMRLGLSLAMMRRCVANVAAGYRTQRQAQLRFHPQTSIPYDRHTLRIDAAEQSVILWTSIGWLRMLFVTDAPSLEGWRLPALMQLRGRWAVLLVMPDREGE